ncbi:hypothetical protein [Acidithiobacillus ferriphilus]|uniref:hypothetical protein n=1 Tax=Acidithiobacillus ferriphilus TaxID=1689834 RepID=UPI001C06E431|nr:hypothetical protein [Acidithiobacillus ferriphilus]MBU2854883.1 hypothetical protein [Acidithiobacillus ferriphilus]
MKTIKISTAVILTILPVLGLVVPSNTLAGTAKDNAVVIVCNEDTGSQSYLPSMTQNSAGTATAVCPKGSYPAAAGLIGGQGLLDAVATAAGIGGAAYLLSNTGSGGAVLTHGVGSPKSIPNLGNGSTSRSGNGSGTGNNGNAGQSSSNSGSSGTGSGNGSGSTGSGSVLSHGNAGTTVSQLHNVSANSISSLATPEVSPAQFGPSGSPSGNSGSGSGAPSPTSQNGSGSGIGSPSSNGSGGFFSKIGRELGKAAENVGHTLLAGPLFNNDSGTQPYGTQSYGTATPAVSEQPFTSAQKQALFEKDLGGPAGVKANSKLLNETSSAAAIESILEKYGLTSSGQNYGLFIDMMLAGKITDESACVGSITSEKMAFEEIPYEVGLETSRMGNYWEKAVRQKGIDSKSGEVGVGYMTMDYQINGPDIYNFNGVQILMPYHFGAYITYIDIKGFTYPAATSMEEKYNPYISANSPSINSYAVNGVGVPNLLFVGPSGLGWKAASSQQAFILTAHHSAGVITTFNLNVPKMPCDTKHRLSVVKNVFKGQNMVSIQMQFKTNNGYVAPYSEGAFHNTQDLGVQQICSDVGLNGVACGNYGLIEIK